MECIVMNMTLKVMQSMIAFLVSPHKTGWATHCLGRQACCNLQSGNWWMHISGVSREDSPGVASASRLELVAHGVLASDLGFAACTKLIYSFPCNWRWQNRMGDPSFLEVEFVICSLGFSDTSFSLSLIFYYFLAMVSLRCCTRAFSSCSKHRLLITVASILLLCRL